MTYRDYSLPDALELSDETRHMIGAAKKAVRHNEGNPEEMVQAVTAALEAHAAALGIELTDHPAAPAAGPNGRQADPNRMDHTP
ncbi:hypothetical protein HQQ80_09370 [Microbacteriaceae bacterium VKM Ac-2855]|nr:hypothetical protein [Microbacteriaceae bacterium VKM Ac-2855]